MGPAGPLIRMATLATILKQSSVPAEHQENFWHLYWDIAWFGVLNASAISFISIYIVRVGATAFQVGLLSAIPAITAIFLSIPSGWWLRNRRVDRITFWMAVFFRSFYFLWILLPVLFSASAQVWVVLGITLLMGLPGTVLSVGFNALFADAVPPQWRGQVVGIRNALLAITFILTALICGVILARVTFPLNYQIVFALGFIGGGMSTYHLDRVRVTGEKPPRVGRTLGDLASPGFPRVVGDTIRPGVGLRFLTRIRTLRLPRFSTLRGPFGKILLILFAFNLAQQLAMPLFPIYWVERLDLPDQVISLGNALFYGMVFLGSTQLAWLTRRWGNYKITVVGALMMACYPGLTAITHEVNLFLITSMIGGAAWSLAGGAMGNYLLDQIPEDERPGHLAWYMVILNAAVLTGSLGGPLLARVMGLVPALMFIALGRAASALAIWRWGQKK